MGHTFGLCDEGYGNCLSDSCPSGIILGVCQEGTGECFQMGSYCCPNSPELNSIMCSSDPCNRGCSFAQRFASTSYAHLENELIVKNKYCG